MKILSEGIAAGENADAFVAVMRDVDFFQTLNDEQLRKVLYFMRALDFDAGEVVFVKDAPGDAFYLIRSGRAEARVPGFFGHKVIGEMGPGDFFGELALILDQPRAATVVCTESTVCLVLAHVDMVIMMDRHPEIATQIKDVAKKRFGQ